VSNKLYIFVFDPQKSDAVSLHKIIKENPMIHDWSHYIAPAYVFASTQSLHTIKADIKSKWPKQSFFMAEITSKNDGWMPKDALTWLAKYEDTK